MFPTWSDWDITYTRKGLTKRTATRALKPLALALLILGVVQQRHNGPVTGVIAQLKALVRALLFKGAGLLQVAGSRV